MNLTSEVWSKLVDSGLTLSLMGIAVWWLQRVLTQLIQKLDAERKERLDAMQAEIDMQRRRNDECEKDRADIHRQLLDLYSRALVPNPTQPK
jgi:hypothetical protein